MMVPNLAALSPYYQVQELAIVPDPLGWTTLAPADPTRWYMLLIDTPGFGGLAALQPDPLFLAGRPLPFAQSLEWEFSKWGSAVGAAWVFWGKGAAQPLTLYTISIRVEPKRLTGE